MIKHIVIIFIIMFLFVSSVAAQLTLDDLKTLYDYDNWPGRNGTVKGDFELPITPFSGYELRLRRNSEDRIYFSKKLTGYIMDVQGHIEILIYPSI